MDGGVVLASDEVYFSLFFFSFHLFGVLGIFVFFLKDEKKYPLRFSVFMGSRHEMSMGEREAEQKCVDTAL
jgi:hypothetical protein